MTKCPKSADGKHEFDLCHEYFPASPMTGDAPECEEVWKCIYCGLALDEEERDD